jgi:hypothetical protein
VVARRQQADFTVRLISPDGKHFIVEDHLLGGTWLIDSNGRRIELLHDSSQYVVKGRFRDGSQFSLDSKLVLTGGGTLYFDIEDQEWRSTEDINPWEARFNPYTINVVPGNFVQDETTGTWTGVGRSRIWVENAITGKAMFELPWPKGSMKWGGTVLSLDGLGYCSHPHTMLSTIYDLRKRSVIFDLELWPITVSDSQRIAAGLDFDRESKTDTLVILDLSSKKTRPIAVVHDQYPGSGYSLLLSPDDQYVMTSRSGIHNVYDIDAKTLIYSFEVEDRYPYHTFAFVGHELVIGGSDGIQRVDLTSGRITRFVTRLRHQKDTQHPLSFLTGGRSGVDRRRRQARDASWDVVDRIRR